MMRLSGRSTRRRPGRRFRNPGWRQMEGSWKKNSTRGALMAAGSFFAASLFVAMVAAFLPRQMARWIRLPAGLYKSPREFFSVGCAVGIFGGMLIILFFKVADKYFSLHSRIRDPR